MTVDEVIIELENSTGINFERSFEIIRCCSESLKISESEGRKLLINILDNLSKIHNEVYEMVSDLIEAAGFYPYLVKNSKSLNLLNISGQLRKELHLSSNIKSRYFHEDQKILLDLLGSDKNVIVSAPTSFGKSLLIEEVIASFKYNNIVIIQPTLALLDETRRKLLMYRSKYKLIVRTSQEPSLTLGNIFLFTAERVNEYKDFPVIEFLAIDEFYKLSGERDDERSSSLNNAFNYLLTTYNPKFYLLGPNIDGISQGFENRYNAIFLKSKYSLVDNRSIDIFKNHEGKFGRQGAKKLYKENVLFDLLVTPDIIRDQTLIYCSSPNRVRYLAKNFTKYLKNKDFLETTNSYPIVEWIEQNINQEWNLLENLKYDIGIHDGALQKHITTSIIDYFNAGSLKYLFCTSTIIEGVNTSAKNIIYFDEKKGPKDVDFFDYSNIKGRAGRMMEHYVGKIYNFNAPPIDEQIIVDIPFHQQDPITDEVLIQLDDKDVLNKNSIQYKTLSKLQAEERAIIKTTGASVFGQKSIIDVLRGDLPRNHHLTLWNHPNYEQLTYVLGLAWNHLIVLGETTRPMTLNKLINMTFNYERNRSIDILIKDNFSYKRTSKENDKLSDADVMDDAIQDTFQIIKHWFEYKVPKWLSVINELQKFVSSEKGLRAGNYTHYANSIENDFLRENLAILAEYGIPSSAIRKIESQIPATIDQDEVLNYIREKKIFNSKKLILYEQNKLRENTNL